MCYNNQLNLLDLSNNINLIGLRCDTNQLNTLDLSDNMNLTVLKCNNNANLNYINLKNENNVNFNISSSSFENLPNLQNVCVDAINTNLTDFITNQTGHSVNYSDICSSLSIDSFATSEFLIFPNPIQETLTIQSNLEISKIEIYDCIGKLILKEKGIEKINLSNLKQGIYLLKIFGENGKIETNKILKK